MNRKLIFISHPSAGDVEGNQSKVLKICKYWYRQGYVPIAPHLLFSYMDSDKERAWIMRVCYWLVMICPVFLSYGETMGCKEELALAKRMGKQIITMYERVNYKRMMEDTGDRR